MSKEALVRLASTMPVGDPNRKLILAAAQKTANISQSTLGIFEKRFIAENKTLFGGRVTDNNWLNGWRAGLDIIWPSQDEYTICSRFEFEPNGSVVLGTFIIFDEENSELGGNLVDATRSFRSNPELIGAGQVDLRALDKRDRIDWPEDESEAYEIFAGIVTDYAAFVSRSVKSIRV